MTLLMPIWQTYLELDLCKQYPKQIKIKGENMGKALEVQDRLFWFGFNQVTPQFSTIMSFHIPSAVISGVKQ